jgi:hypothetical protein
MDKSRQLRRCRLIKATFGKGESVCVLCCFSLMLFDDCQHYPSIMPLLLKCASECKCGELQAMECVGLVGASRWSLYMAVRRLTVMYSDRHRWCPDSNNLAELKGWRHHRPQRLELTLLPLHFISMIVFKRLAPSMIFHGFLSHRLTNVHLVQACTVTILCQDGQHAHDPNGFHLSPT